MDTVWTVVATILGILWGLMLYMIKARDKKIEKLEERTADQQLELQELQNKIWGEDKLQQIVQQAVCNAMNQFKLELYEEGVLKPKKQ
jgi:hypothetical protein